MSSRQLREPLTHPVSWADSRELPTAAFENFGPAPPEDADLLTGLQALHSSDLDFLFDRYSRLVFGTARRVLGNPSEAEDVVQEVFLYLYRKSDCFNPAKGSLKAWIIQITFCRALDRKFYLARRGFHAGGDIDSVQLRGEVDLERQVHAKFSRKHLESALAELTEMQRRTINFFYFEDLNLKEISEVLSQPLGTVRHHLYRGLEKLRKSSRLHQLL